ncbi:MAG: Gfo/Idh/MocA family oxidoreductase [Clostridia bacterium]|nr:Gfo/Idh/MocA family oxidoreductase [Clostridia bacterium]
MKKVRLAIVGTGAIAFTHTYGIQRLDEAELVAICDVVPSQMEHYRKTFPMDDKDCYTDYREILKRDDVDAVIVCASDEAHRNITVDALRAGKDVLCEKPMALKVDECREMIKVAEEMGKRLMIGQVCRKAPGFIKAKELVEKGEIGEVFFMESEYAHDYCEIPGINNWRKVPERQPIIGGGCHAVDLMRWILGDPSEAFAYANHKMLPGWPIDDCVVSVLKFPNDVIGKVFTSIGCKRKYTMRTVIYGSKGTIITDNTSETISLFREVIDGEKSLYGVHNQTIEMKIPVSIDSHNMTEEIRDFINCINNDLPADPDGKQGFYTVAVCDAIVRSSKTGEKITIDYTV